jgi:hypothetical protein
MRLNSPKFITWLISLILGIIGLVSVFIAIPYISAYAFWIVLIGLALLLMGNAIKGL